MANTKKFRVFATSRIGDAAENRLRERGYDLEVFEGPEAPPKKLIIEKVKSGIDGLITTLRDPINVEVFEAGKGTLKVVAQIAVGFDNINRADANKSKIPFTNTADVLTEARERLAFRHDLLRQIIYAELPLSVRQALHRDAATALRRLGEPLGRHPAKPKSRSGT